MNTGLFCGQKERKIVEGFCMQLCIITSGAMIMLLRRPLTYKNLVSFNHWYGKKRNFCNGKVHLNQEGSSLC